MDFEEVCICKKKKEANYNEQSDLIKLYKNF